MDWKITLKSTCGLIPATFVTQCQAPIEAPSDTDEETTEAPIETDEEPGEAPIDTDEEPTETPIDTDEEPTEEKKKKSTIVTLETIVENFADYFQNAEDFSRMFEVSHRTRKGGAI